MRSEKVRENWGWARSGQSEIKCSLWRVMKFRKRKDLLSVGYFEVSEICFFSLDYVFDLFIITSSSVVFAPGCFKQMMMCLIRNIH